MSTKAVATFRDLFHDLTFCRQGQQIVAEDSFAQEFPVELDGCLKGEDVKVWDEAQKIQWLTQSAYFMLQVEDSVVKFVTVNPTVLIWKKIATYDVPRGCTAVPSFGHLVFLEKKCLVACNWQTGQKRYLTNNSMDEWENIHLMPDGSVAADKTGSGLRYVWNLGSGQHNIQEAELNSDVSIPEEEETREELDRKIAYRQKTRQKFEKEKLAWYGVENLAAAWERGDIQEQLIDQLVTFYKEHPKFCEPSVKLSENLLLSNGTIAVPCKKNDYPTQFAIVRGDGCKLYSRIQGWSVTLMKELSNGLLAVGTASRGATLTLFAPEGTGLTQVATWDFDNSVTDIQELASGHLVVVAETQIVILTPLAWQMEKNKEYQIANLTQKIYHFPDRLGLYEKLAALQENREDQINTLLSGIRPALRQNKSYTARRLFEECKKRGTLPPEAYQHYCEQLRSVGLYREARKVELELYHIHPDEELLGALPTNARCKRRLFVGEGGLSYTAALLDKHQKTHTQLAKAITATELRWPKDEELDRLRSLASRGVTILHGVDATQIHKRFRGQRYERIHWNLPYAVKLEQPDEHKGTIEHFFRAASFLQLPGDRVHLALGSSWSQVENERLRNPLLAPSLNSGYRLVRKRAFDKFRYPSYQPVKSETGEELIGYDDNREWVFEKTHMNIAAESSRSRLQLAKEQTNPRDKTYTVKGEKEEELYYDCSTDGESSDYYESDEEALTPPPVDRKRKAPEGQKPGAKRVKIDPAALKNS